jgi:hypothetical protein
MPLLPSQNTVYLVPQGLLHHKLDNSDNLVQVRMEWFSFRDWSSFMAGGGPEEKRVG